MLPVTSSQTTGHPHDLRGTPDHRVERGTRAEHALEGSSPDGMGSPHASDDLDRPDSATPGASAVATGDCNCLHSPTEGPARLILLSLVPPSTPATRCDPSYGSRCAARYGSSPVAVCPPLDEGLRDATTPRYVTMTPVVALLPRSVAGLADSIPP